MNLGDYRMALPIFFIHKGNSEYLKYTLAQAKHQCPESIVYLIGDPSNDTYDFVKHANIADYRDEVFSSVYEHFSSNTYEYELFCFERWFVLRNFIIQNKIAEDFLYLDSDVMLFSNVNQCAAEWRSYKMAICSPEGPEYSYFQNSAVLAEYCNFIITMYTGEKNRAKIRSKYEFYIDSPEYIGGGICDMTLLGWFAETQKEHLLDLGLINDGKTIFEHNINNADGFVLDNKRKIKKISFSKNQAFLCTSETKELIRLHAAHFQGNSKQYIPKFYTGGLYWYLVTDVVARFIAKCRVKLKREIGKFIG